MSVYKDFAPMSFDDIETYELASRPSKVSVDDFARPVDAAASMPEFIEGLPDILSARSLRAVANAVCSARELGKPIIWGIGGHVVKTGLAPVLIDLLKDGFVTAIATNGSVLVHDLEIALAGFTSEDVDASLGKGAFGAARETGEMINGAAALGSEEAIGLGEAVGRAVSELGPRYSDRSLLYATYENRVPLTAHVTIGADIGHFHPGADGAALGAASHTDFRLFCSIVGAMDGGGVYLNFGSAVVLPEVFLKALTVNRNLGNAVNGITTANFDFIQHYRPLTNVVKRPTADGAGKGYAVTGPHELLLPLLAAAIRCREGK